MIMAHNAMTGVKGAKARTKSKSARVQGGGVAAQYVQGLYFFSKIVHPQVQDEGRKVFCVCSTDG